MVGVVATLPMQAFVRHQGIAAPLMEGSDLYRNVNTDAIIPSREMKQVSKTSLADGLFANWRYVLPDSRQTNHEFVLNQPPFSEASMLLAGENFGCGSSREQAVWALAEFGIRAIIAPSFGAIFARNCLANGLLTVSLAAQVVERMAHWVMLDPPQHQPLIDLQQGEILAADGRFPFTTPPAARLRLLQGLDHITLTLAQGQEIDAFEAGHFERFPWLVLD